MNRDRGSIGAPTMHTSNKSEPMITGHTMSNQIGIKIKINTIKIKGNKDLAVEWRDGKREQAIGLSPIPHLE